MKHFYGTFFLIGRAILRPFARIGEVPEGHPEACVYICRHRNMEGPVRVALNFRENFHIWAYSVFTDREECFRQYYGYTFTARFGWPRPVAYVVARLGSIVVPAFMRSMRAIPVYRGSAAVIKTYRKSVSALLKGESLMIFPDVDYREDSGNEVAFYDGFLLLHKLYRQKGGNPLAFVPLYVDAKRRRILKGGAVYIEAGMASSEMIARLIGAIEGLSRAE